MATSPEPGLPADSPTLAAPRPWVLIHYDLTANQGTVRRYIDRFLFGFKETRTVRGTRKTYTYPGLLARAGGRHFGQSVVLVSPGAAIEAVSILEELHVAYARLDLLTRAEDSPVEGVA